MIVTQGGVVANGCVSASDERAAWVPIIIGLAVGVYFFYDSRNSCKNVIGSDRGSRLRKSIPRYGCRAIIV